MTLTERETGLKRKNDEQLSKTNKRRITESDEQIGGGKSQTSQGSFVADQNTIGDEHHEDSQKLSNSVNPNPTGDGYQEAEDTPNKTPSKTNQSVSCHDSSDVVHLSYDEKLEINKFCKTITLPRCKKDFLNNRNTKKQIDTSLLSKNSTSDDQNLSISCYDHSEENALPDSAVNLLTYNSNPIDNKFQNECFTGNAISHTLQDLNITNSPSNLHPEPASNTTMQSTLLPSKINSPTAAKEKKSESSSKTHVCNNCQTEETECWRKDTSNNNLLCNPCGLHFYKHGKHRIPESTKKRNVELMTGHICHNCKADKTTSWRRDFSDNIVCNPCGHYDRKHRKPRPPHLYNKNKNKEPKIRSQNSKGRKK